jgi:hypothetical protein
LAIGEKDVILGYKRGNINKVKDKGYEKRRN